MPTVVLASASPRRRDLLRSAGWRVELRPTATDERPLPGESVIDHVRRLARDKLLAARSHPASPGTPEPDPNWPWLAADTVVWRTEDRPLGKPSNRVDAKRILQSLTGGEPHRVTTGWALATDRNAEPELHHETTQVWMRPLAPAELNGYLDTDEWTDKAGGYGIQGAAASWVTRIEGSYTNVVGLPVAQVVERLIS